LQRKTPKRFEVVKTYLLKICDQGHHVYYDVHLKLSPEEFAELYEGKVDIKKLKQRGDFKEMELSEWDKFLEGRGQSNTAELIERDVNLYWAINNLCSQKGISTGKAADALIGDWPSDIKEYLGKWAIKEIYKKWTAIFRFRKRIPLIDGATGKQYGWTEEEPFLNFSLRDAAAYALRETKVLTGRYPISRPTGILEKIHKILELPFEEDIEREIEIYQRIRKKSFGVTYIHPLRLKWLSMGKFKERFENRSEKIISSIKELSKKYKYDLDKLITLYSHYRLIEAEDNGQDRSKVYEQLELDLRNIKLS